jgi:hypothetical protein
MSEDMDPLRAVRPTLNPYLSGAGMVLRRLAWDLRLESWRSRAKVRKWKDRFEGEKAVILCNGPSLLDVDLSMLDGTFTFGLNKINLLFSKSDFRPSCIVAVNLLVIDQNTGFYNETDIPLFLDRHGHGLVSPRRTVSFLHSSSQAGFARDCSWSINQGCTVTYVAMQLAFHMGFREVALVGCDHNFAVKGPANSTVVAGERDDSHFDPNYFADGVKWQLPDLFESEVAYTRAKNMYEAFDRKIVNATEGGELTIFERESLGQFLART